MWGGIWEDSAQVLCSSASAVDVSEISLVASAYRHALRQQTGGDESCLDLTSGLTVRVSTGSLRTPDFCREAPPKFLGSCLHCLA